MDRPIAAAGPAAGRGSGGESGRSAHRPRRSRPTRRLLQGLRGSAPGSFEAAHALAQGEVPGEAHPGDEPYDLVVVGGGISGLAAAYFYRAGAAQARAS